MIAQERLALAQERALEAQIEAQERARIAIEEARARGEEARLRAEQRADEIRAEQQRRAEERAEDQRRRAAIDSVEGPEWVKDSDAPKCQGCNEEFTQINRRHHCRGCGKCMCGKCTDYWWVFHKRKTGTEAQRVCLPCQNLLKSWHPATHVPTKGPSFWQKYKPSALKRKIKDKMSVKKHL